VEQLRVHVRNLSMLGVDGAGNSKGRVELYEKGYGKDAAGIAKEAIAYGELHRCADLSAIDIDLGRDNEFDVVLIDTAGRMQDNEVCATVMVHCVSAHCA
jgi:signal recognition particle receptor subunit alpha